MPSNVEEFTWVTDHRLDVPDPDGAMTDRARMALVDHMSAATDRPGRRLPWLIAATAVAAVRGRRGGPRRRVGCRLGRAQQRIAYAGREPRAASRQAVVRGAARRGPRRSDPRAARQRNPGQAIQRRHHAGSRADGLDGL